MGRRGAAAEEEAQEAPEDASAREEAEAERVKAALKRARTLLRDLAEEHVRLKGLLQAYMDRDGCLNSSSQLSQPVESQTSQLSEMSEIHSGAAAAEGGDGELGLELGPPAASTLSESVGGAGLSSRRNSFGASGRAGTMNTQLSQLSQPGEDEQLQNVFDFLDGIDFEHAALVGGSGAAAVDEDNNQKQQEEQEEDEEGDEIEGGKEDYQEGTRGRGNTRAAKRRRVDDSGDHEVEANQDVEDDDASEDNGGQEQVHVALAVLVSSKIGDGAVLVRPQTANGDSSDEREQYDISPSLDLAKLSVPGGLLLPGERWQDAARRTVMHAVPELSSVQPTFLRVTNDRDLAGKHYVTIFMQASVVPDAARAALERCEDWVWMPWAEVVSQAPSATSCMVQALCHLVRANFKPTFDHSAAGAAAMARANGGHRTPGGTLASPAASLASSAPPSSGQRSRRRR